ncbi:type VI secretion system protein IglI family protein [Pseudofrancisella aestuarii]|uniref:Type VI secretion system protein IglI family protein n=1 Tax=Pseudofrancisella aestuarii TaxID=2670347 RepID=A0ABV9TBJ0_9GAMM|nr:type VI secretion system protein IglI family protein [Pseudofrancisella aestuarii]
MSELINILEDSSINTLERINPVNNLQLYAKYENAEYQAFLTKLIENVEDSNNIDIYSLFIALNSEICLNLDNLNSIPDIINKYLIFVENNFENISPKDSSQKNELSEKGINLFISVIDSNFSEISNNLEISNSFIELVIKDIESLISFFESNSIKYNKTLKQQLISTLKKVEASIVTDTSEEDNSKTIEPSKKKNLRNKADSKRQLNSSQNQNFRSHKWLTLIEKIEVLKELIENERIFETSIVYDDIQNLLVNFDPKEYFPEIFFPLYKKVAPYIKDIHKNIDLYSSSIQWSIAKKMYNIDYNEFLENYEKMPENKLINTPLAESHFYGTSSEAQDYSKEENRILSDEEAYKEDISINNKPSSKNKELSTKFKQSNQEYLDNNENNVDEDSYSYNDEGYNSKEESEEDLNKLFDF